MSRTTSKCLPNKCSYIYLDKSLVDIVGLLESVTTNSHIGLCDSFDCYLLLGFVAGESDIKRNV